MKDQKKEYNGFWKHLGCTLFAIVGLVFVWIIWQIINLMFFKF
ncbi:hypothetical protein [Psychroserpens mesophilus]